VDGNLVIQKIILSALIDDEGDENFDWTAFINLVGANSLFNLKIGNDVVLKDIPLIAFGSLTAANFAGLTTNGKFGVLVPINSIVIPPQIEFEATITCASATDATVLSVRCILQGFGTQFSNANY
jgi:hypothetical protein